MGQDLQLPDWAKKGPAQAFKGSNPMEDSLSDGIGQSYGIIGYKGSKWSLRIGGEEHFILRPDDGTPSSYIDVVIVGQARTKSRTFYEGGFEDGSKKRPTCASLHGVVPDADVVAKQHPNCTLCPRNVPHNNPVTGKQTRDCKEHKRLAVLITPALTEKILGKPLAEPVFLRVPGGSLTALGAMGVMMENQNFHYYSYVTRISFEPTAAYPSMLFQAVAPIEGQAADNIVELRKNAHALIARIVGEDKAPITHQDVTVYPPAVTSGNINGNGATPQQVVGQMLEAAALADPDPVIADPAPAKESDEFDELIKNLTAQHATAK